LDHPEKGADENSSVAAENSFVAAPVSLFKPTEGWSAASFKRFGQSVMGLLLLPNFSPFLQQM